MYLIDDYLGNFFSNCVYYWTETFFKRIALFKSSSEKDACFSCERCKNWICGNCLPKTFFDYSDMSLTWTLNLPFSTKVTCRISRKGQNENQCLINSDMSLKPNTQL
ncbi:hypothetical protein BpHYR1_006599 [Brachionus plicatilis]|uniref:Uncharacterized protein n=1 Tax=Brachionus plicatilis TaxID=10195 RepID=A0A3M7RAF6_BRAPC|nr:hypothetical protein BpHYR1_006599 [Brachionus plicatilis]